MGYLAYSEILQMCGHMARDERGGIKSYYEGQEFLYRVTKALLEGERETQLIYTKKKEQAFPACSLKPNFL